MQREIEITHFANGTKEYVLCASGKMTPFGGDFDTRQVITADQCTELVKQGVETFDTYHDDESHRRELGA